MACLLLFCCGGQLGVTGMLTLPGMLIAGVTVHPHRLASWLAFYFTGVVDDVVGRPDRGCACSAQPSTVQWSLQHPALAAMSLPPCELWHGSTGCACMLQAFAQQNWCLQREECVWVSQPFGQRGLAGYCMTEL